MNYSEMGLMAEHVRAHMESIVAGNVPFGLKVSEE